MLLKLPSMVRMSQSTCVISCRVIAWEPVPHFRAFLEYAIALNNLTAVIEVRPFAVADKAGETYNLVVPQRGIWGTASINGGNIDRSCTALSSHALL